MTRVKKSQKGPKWTAPQERGLPTWPQDTEIMIHEARRLKREDGDRL